MYPSKCSTLQITLVALSLAAVVGTGLAWTTELPGASLKADFPRSVKEPGEGLTSVPVPLNVSIDVCSTGAGISRPSCLDTPASAGGATLSHVVKAGENLGVIAARYRHLSRHYTLNEFLSDIRQVNALASDLLRPGRELLIPLGQIRSGPLVSEPVSEGATLRGIYLPGPACGTAAVFERIDRFIAAGGNAVVIDGKDIDGGVTFASSQKLASWGRERQRPLISRLPELLGRLHTQRVYVAVRIACFLDGELGRKRPDLALTDSLGAPWTEKGQVWIDPAQPEVRSYLLGLAIDLARLQVDEIQFDYVRFPTNGWPGGLAGDHRAAAAYRRQVISSFLREARLALADYPVRIAADLYGVMAWGRTVDEAATGQHIPSIAQQVDVICPMVYPSHYRQGFSGVDRPADHPAAFVAEGCRRFRELAGEHAAIRPWLQAFPYGVGRYDHRYVLAQVEGALKVGADGWCLWNPAGRYDAALGSGNVDLGLATSPPTVGLLIDTHSH